MQKWDIPARVLEALLLTVIVIQAVIYRDQIEEMRLDRRAWVSVRQTKGFPKVGERVRFEVSFTNTGRTFAKHLKAVAATDKYELGAEPNFVKEIEARGRKLEPKAISDVLLAPNAVIETVLNASADAPKATSEGIDELKDRITHGQVKYLMFGQVTYEDIFGRRHWIIFCDFLGYDPMQSEDGGWAWNTYYQWNDTGDGDPPVRN